MTIEKFNEDVKNKNIIGYIGRTFTLQTPTGNKSPVVCIDVDIIYFPAMKLKNYIMKLQTLEGKTFYVEDEEFKEYYKEQ